MRSWNFGGLHSDILGATWMLGVGGQVTSIIKNFNDFYKQ